MAILSPTSSRQRRHLKTAMIDWSQYRSLNSLRKQSLIRERNRCSLLWGVFILGWWDMQKMTQFAYRGVPLGLVLGENIASVSDIGSVPYYFIDHEKLETAVLVSCRTWYGNTAGRSLTDASCCESREERNAVVTSALMGTKFCWEIAHPWDMRPTCILFFFFEIIVIMTGNTKLVLWWK
jgi:hypothetical protein